MKTFLLICGIMFTMSSLAATISDAEETIKIGGTGSGLGVMKILGKAFEKKHPGTIVEVLPSLGSAGGIKGVTRGLLDIGISARPFKGDETSVGFSAMKYAETPLVIVTRKDTMVSDLKTEDLVKIYDGRLLAWADGKRIRPVLRPEEEFDTQILKEWTPEIKKALETASSRKGMLIAITAQDTTNTIEKTPGAFGFSTLAQVIAEKLTLKILSLNGIYPTAGTLSDGSYKLKKSLYFVTRSETSAKVEKFLVFVRSPAGTKILKECGYIVSLQTK